MEEEEKIKIEAMEREIEKTFALLREFTENILTRLKDLRNGPNRTTIDSDPERGLK